MLKVRRCDGRSMMKGFRKPPMLAKAGVQIWSLPSSTTSLSTTSRPKPTGLANRRMRFVGCVYHVRADLEDWFCSGSREQVTCNFTNLPRKNNDVRNHEGHSDTKHSRLLHVLKHVKRDVLTLPPSYRLLALQAAPVWSCCCA